MMMLNFPATRPASGGRDDRQGTTSASSGSQETNGTGRRPRRVGVLVRHAQRADGRWRGGHNVGLSAVEAHGQVKAAGVLVCIAAMDLLRAAARVNSRLRILQ